MRSSASVAISEQEYAERRERLAENLEERGLDAIFLPPSSDLEYLTGLGRDLPSFGNLSYAHGWVAGAFVAPGREPLFVLPRMVVDFHLGGIAPPAAVVVREDADGRALFGEAARSLGAPSRLAIGARAWAETALELQHALPGVELMEGSSLVNRLRRVKSEAELQLMGRACAVARAAMAATAPRVEPGVTMGELAEEVEHRLRAAGSRCPSFPTHVFTWGDRPLDSGDATATERLPDAAGLGGGFRHRMGHGIGLDVHERPFLSVEDETPLEAGMTFTDEPSILVDGRFGVRVEDVIAVAPGGARLL